MKKALCCWLLVAAPSLAQTTTSVADRWTGRVVDPDGRPIAAAQVFALPHEKERVRPESQGLYWLRLGRDLIPLGCSDAEGKVEVTAVPAGFYDLGVRAKGFGPLVRAGVRSGLGQVVELVLQPAFPTRGKVVDENGAGIAGVDLFYNIIDPQHPLEVRVGAGGDKIATSGDDGEFQFAEVESGQHIYLLAWKEGLVAASLNLQVGPGDPVVVPMRRGGKVVGRITAAGQPVPNVRVLADAIAGDPASEGTRPRFVALSDAEGNFSMDGFGAGRFQLTVQRAPGMKSYQGAPFEVGGGETRVLDIELEPAVPEPNR